MVLDSLQLFFDSYGYLAVFLVLILCGLGLPIPEDISLLAGGIVAGLGGAHLTYMIIVGMVGVLLGDLLVFSLGYILGDKITKIQWLGKLLTEKNYAKMQDYFDKYGSGAIFIGRFLPGLRTPMFIIAGLSKRVTYLRFLLIDAMAAIISVPLWLSIGYYFAKNKVLLMVLVNNFKFIISILLITLIFIGLIRWYCQRIKYDE